MTTNKGQQQQGGNGNQPKQPQLAKKVTVLITGTGTIQVDAPANIDGKFQTGSFTVKHGATVTIKATRGTVRHFAVNGDDIQRGQQWSETIKTDTTVEVVFDESAEPEKAKAPDTKETQVTIRVEGKGAVSFAAEGVDDFMAGEPVTLNKGQEFTIIAEPADKYRLKRMQVGARVISGRTTASFIAEGKAMIITIVFDKKAPAHGHADHNDEHDTTWWKPWTWSIFHKKDYPEEHTSSEPESWWQRGSTLKFLIGFTAVITGAWISLRQPAEQVAKNNNISECTSQIKAAGKAGVLPSAECSMGRADPDSQSVPTVNFSSVAEKLQNGQLMRTDTQCKQENGVSKPGCSISLTPGSYTLIDNNVGEWKLTGPVIVSAHSCNGRTKPMVGALWMATSSSSRLWTQEIQDQRHGSNQLHFDRCVIVTPISQQVQLTS